MKWFLPVICLLLILSACQAPGTEGGKCLEGNTCSGSSLICNPRNKCEPCGEKGKSCCSGDACQEGLSCTEWGLCYECGGYGQPCCEGGGCQVNYLCDADNTCQSCGMQGSPCCEDSVCQVGSTCDQAGMCVTCGMSGQPCCLGSEYPCWEGACVADNTCQTQICDAGGNCTECGILTEPCCEGGVCGTGYICDNDGLCTNCGWRGDPVCADGACQGYWQNVNGLCENPFEIDAAADIALCEKVEPGYSNRNERDWCYWYAAFHKKDTSPCAMIVWSTMKEKCLALADPDEYSVTSW